uniref:Luciferase-like domain-containing protein n=1 Tax=Bacillus amyloliquefaciens TaxID=1390 RepID=Q9F9Q6_BACAM|nr:unknown [Bacillus amyloliquefaciens]
MRAEHHDCMEIGIYSFAELYPDPLTGKTVSAKQRLDELIKLAKLADDAGLDVFGVGEHHRLDYAVSSPPVILSAISQLTENIKLTSATTVLSTEDPVRLFEDFATLDLISNGRAEIIAGRGAFLDSFPLFGYDVGHYKELFEEHIELFLTLNSEEEVITWKGCYRPPLNNAEISPQPFHGSIPLWLGVSGTPESAERAGSAGAGLALAVLSGDPRSSKPLVDKYREAASKAGHPPENVKVAVTGHTISKTNEQAIQEFYPYHSNYWSRVHSYHGIHEPLTKEDFERAAGKETALFVGSSQQIIEKIMHQYELFGHQRFLAQIDIGGMPFKKAAENIERLATEVAPVIRKETSKASD